MKSPLFSRLPNTPGVYLMKDIKGEILYIGKASNLKRRVSSYFQRSHEFRIERLVAQIKKIDYKKTDTALEALILEAELIREHQPPYNVLEKDNKSFLYVQITDESFPCINLVRGKDLNNSDPSNTKSKNSSRIFGPFVSGRSLREALKIIRRIFPYSTHSANQKKPCFDYQLGLCPGTCIGAINEKDYNRNVYHIKLFFRGKKKQILASLKKEMSSKAKMLEFEKAEILKKQIFALEHIQDIALISKANHELRTSPTLRIEGYDISNISGTSAVGSMVVFIGDQPDKSQYRKFKIKTVQGANDIGMLKEVLGRRFRKNFHSSQKDRWPLPGLILIDGGRGQVNAVKSVLREKGLNISVVGIAKGPERKRNDIVGYVPEDIRPETLIRVRDEAHRFAIQYHKKLRSRDILS